jgi:hypothetical protein
VKPIFVLVAAAVAGCFAATTEEPRGTEPSPAPAVVAPEPGTPLAACSLLTRAEVAELVGGAVEIKPDETGPDDRGDEHCAWRRVGAPGAALIVSPLLLRADYDIDSLLLESSIEPTRHALPDLGDQAWCRVFDNRAGATLVVHAGARALVLSGTPFCDVLTRGARIALRRLGG